MRSTPPSPIAAVVKKIPKKDEEMIAFYQQAISFGIICTPITDVKSEVARQIASRMVKRDGEKFLWQTGTPIVRLFPEQATSIFPETLLTEESATQKQWTASSVEELILLFQPLLAESSSCCAGLAKAFRSASERVIRVVATIMPPATLTWTRTPMNKPGSLSGLFWYILFDEAGERHAPKTMTSEGGRAEVALTDELEQQMREKVHADLMLMSDRDEPLAPGFLRQLGRFADADVLQAQLLSQTAAPQKTSSVVSKRQKRPPLLKGVFEVDTILDERPGTRTTEPAFLVRWNHAAYHPSWEVYRTEGEAVGTPMATWEPISLVSGTEAYLAWQNLLE